MSVDLDSLEEQCETPELPRNKKRKQTLYFYAF